MKTYCTLLEFSHKVGDKGRFRDVLTDMVRGEYEDPNHRQDMFFFLVKYRDGAVAEEFARGLRAEGFHPADKVSAHLIASSMQEQQVHKTWDWLQFAHEGNNSLCIPLLNKVAHFFLDHNKPEYAWQACRWMERRHATAHGDLLLRVAQSFVSAHQLDQALHVAKIMQDARHVQLADVLEALVQGRGAAHDLAGAQAAFAMAVKNGLGGHARIVSALMQAYGAAHQAEAGLDFFQNQTIPDPCRPDWQSLQAEADRWASQAMEDVDAQV
jgi:hypothetical protein